LKKLKNKMNNNLNMNIIIISLERAKERREKIISQLKTLDIEATILDAVDGKTLSEEEKNKYINNPGGWRHGEKFKPGEIGCIMSTINAINLAKKNKWEYVTIMDDDVILSEDFKKGFNFIFKIIPSDWQHIFLGGFIYFASPPIFQPSVVPVTYKVSGSYCYVLRNTIYDIFIKALSTFELPVDDTIEKLYKNKIIKSYIFFPFLAYPNVEYSYIWEIKDPGKVHPSIKYFKNKIF